MIPLLAAVNIYWFLVPLVVTISLVFSATRHEEWKPIFSGTIHTVTWLLIFLGIFFVVLFVVSWWT